MKPRQLVWHGFLIIFIFYEFHFRCAKCDKHTYGFEVFAGERFGVNSVNRIELKSIVRVLIFLRSRT